MEVKELQQQSNIVPNTRRRKRATVQSNNKKNNSNVTKDLFLFPKILTAYHNFSNFQMHPFCDDKQGETKMPACFFQRNRPITRVLLVIWKRRTRFTESYDGWFLTNKTFLHSISNNACSSSNAG
jgi:hypothetical protein